MTLARTLRAAYATLASLGAGGAGDACADPGSTECRCASPSVVIEVPADRAASVTGVAFSGPACAQSQAACIDAADAGCTRLAFNATRAGACSVDVEFNASAASFQASLTFVQSTCCAGFYPQVPSDATLVVPDVGDDAGAAE
jgi:hypothetical protein